MPPLPALATAVLDVKNIKGLIPAVDPKIIEKPFVIDGRNFLLDLDGPYSGFANSIATYHKITSPENFQSFRTPSTIYYIGTGILLSLNTTSLEWHTLYTFTDDGTIWPWTMALIANKYYFSKKGVAGIVRWDPATFAGSLITASVPSGARAVCADGDRLVCLGETSVGWTALSDGTDFVPSLVTGAGFQGLSLVGGTGITVKSVTGGFNSYTTVAIMRSDITNTPSVYRHYPFEHTYIPVTPFAAIELDNRTHLVLDYKGLFITDGASFTAFQPLFGEYLSHKLLRRLNLTGNNAAIKLYCDPDQKLLCISIATQYSANLMEFAYVLYLTKDEWGRFDQLHYNFVEIPQLFGGTETYFTGFISDTMYMRVFVDSQTHIEPDPDNGLMYLFSQYANSPTRNADGLLIGSSLMRLTSTNEASLFTTSHLSRVYGQSSPTIIGVYLYTPSPLNAWVKVGLFKFSDQTRDNQMSQVLSLAVTADINFQANEDWNISTDPDEDWLTSSARNEDWGQGVPEGVNYSLTLRGTNDGVLTFGDQEEIPTLATDSGSIKYYTAFQNNGVYHDLTVGAFNSGETFQLKLIDLTGTLTGQL